MRKKHYMPITKPKVSKIGDSTKLTSMNESLNKPLFVIFNHKLFEMPILKDQALIPLKRPFPTSVKLQFSKPIANSDFLEELLGKLVSNSNE